MKVTHKKNARLSMDKLTFQTLDLIEQHLDIASVLLRNVRAQIEQSKLNTNNSAKHEMLTVTEQQTRDEFLESIQTAGSQGLTRRDMSRHITFSSQPAELCETILKTLEAEGKIRYCRIKKRGRARKAFVATEDREIETASI